MIEEMLEVKQMIKKLSQKNRENEMQLEVPIIVEDRAPINSQGVTGDRKIVRIGNDYYQYTKINNEWYKVQLEKA
jgi:hypothetical protein